MDFLCLNAATHLKKISNDCLVAKTCNSAVKVRHIYHLMVHIITHTTTFVFIGILASTDLNQ